MKKLLLIDGSNLIFRAYYGTENINIKNPQNVSINAVYGLINMLNKIMNDEKPTHVFIALDGAKSTFRHKMFDDYKGKRVSTPEKLKEQFPIIMEYFDSLGIKRGESIEYEADDLIATYAREGQKQGYEVKVISGDKDLLQLIDENIQVFTPKNGFAKECNYTKEVFFEKYEFEPSRFIEYKALVGDTSDNIIGIEKLGDKTAKKFLKASDSIEEIIEQAQNGEIKGKVGENLKNNIELIHRNLKLVTLVDDVQLEDSLDELEFEGIDVKAYGKFLKDNGLMKIYKTLLKDNGIEHKEEEIKFSIVEDFSITNYIKGTTYLYTQNLKENYIISENLGIAFTNELGNFYMPLEKVNEEFKNFIKGDNPKIFYNLKSFIVNTKIVEVNGIISDIFIALSLINSDNYKKSIDLNLITYGIYSIKPFEEVYKAKSNPKKPNIEIVQKDLIAKVLGVKVASEEIILKIEDLDLVGVLFNIELPLTFVLAKMEINGIYIDNNKLKELEEKYFVEVNKNKEKLLKYADINFNSFSQLSKLLFETWDLPKKGMKKATSSYSTDEDNLQKLLVNLNEDSQKYEKEIAFINALLEYRKANKLLNTYVENIKKFILEDNKVHPINHQLLAETGRLSVMDPSIQNMPIRTELGQEIRSLFASKDNLIIALDYSQIELRIMAHFSKDKAMIEAFNEDLDIHTKTAQKIFSIDSVTPLQRSQAKAINFGIIYGMSSYGLAKQVGISNSEAQMFIDKYFLEYPNIKNYMSDVVSLAKQEGEVKTLFKRIRKIENINSKNYSEKEAANRMAINTPIQGTAADIMKMALIKVDKALTENNLKSIIVMQIHDEIVLDVLEEEKDVVIQVVKEAMESVVTLDVRLKVDFGFGKTWLDAK